jgi:hypothetical protein
VSRLGHLLRGRCQDSEERIQVAAVVAANRSVTRRPIATAACHRHREEATARGALCRLGEAAPGCDCLLQASDDPRRFLEFDVQPCLGYSPEQPHMLQRSRRSREQFEAAIDNDRIAFFMGDSKQSVTIWDISGESYDRIVASRTCLPLYVIFRVCSPHSHQ